MLLSFQASSTVSAATTSELNQLEKVKYMVKAQFQMTSIVQIKNERTVT